MKFCSIASGSSGNCIFVGSEQTSVLIDAGISGKRILDGLHGIDRKPEEVDAILVTHEHSDHIKGLGVLMRKYGCPVYCTEGTKNALLYQAMLGKVDPSLIHTISAEESFFIKELQIQPFRISHDAAEPVAYRFSREKKSVAVATDLGYYDDNIIHHLKNLDALLLEANHDIHMVQVGKYPYYLKQRILGLKGHLSNEDAGRLLCEILHDRLKAVFLGHLSHENNYGALALASVNAEITMGAVPYKAGDFPIEIAGRDAPTRLVSI